MVTAIVDRQEFPDLDQILLSSDKSQIFRLFVSKSTLFFDKSREVDIYIIPVLQLPDVGDPVTTNLAKALSIALRYRSLFLERLSPYTRLGFGFEHDEGKFKQRARALLKELRVLFVRGEQARLADPQNIAELFGSDTDAFAVIGEMTCIWNQHKVALSAAIEAVLAGPLTGDNRKRLLENVDAFCGALEKMNTTYLDAATKRLKQVLDC